MTITLNGTTGITSPGGDTGAADFNINGLTVGKGGGSPLASTVVGLGAAASSSGTGYSTAYGYHSLASNTSGQNSAFGVNSLTANTTGNSNSTFGDGSLASNTTGNYNTAVGNSALTSNTTASNNTAVGYQAGYSNTTGIYNAFFGYQAGYSNAVSAAAGNTFIGALSGNLATTGTINTFVGASSGTAITTGSKNTILGGYTGNQGGLDIRTASNYIVLSDGDGNPRGIFDGSGNLLVGTTSTIGNGTFVVKPAGAKNGYTYYAGADNQNAATFLNVAASQVGSIYCTAAATSYITTSDYRLKENVAPMIGALNKVQALKPVTYTWKIGGTPSQGFIAHELQEFCPEAVVGKKDAVDDEGNPIYQGIDTSFLVATLTAAIQELKAEFDAYKSTHP
jgi:hypothetical protein